MVLDLDTKLESISIDELWKVSSPGKDQEVVFYNAEEQEREEVVSEYYSGDESARVGESLSLRFFLSTPSSCLQEAANLSLHKPQIDSVGNEEHTEGAESTSHMDNESIPTTVTMHTNELFNECDGVITVHIDRNPPSSSVPSDNLPSLIPIHLKFEDIKYKVFKRGSKTQSFKALRQKQHAVEKVVLNGVSGSVAPGQILAMMGPSGSGKTSLLNILGGRLHENVTGNVTFNGIVYSSALKSRIGYVTQDDILFPNLTVRETLVFAALLRLSVKMSHKEKIQRADTVLRELGLERCKNTIVGGTFVRGASGGERKRTSIGYEILVDPSVLLLDEPTSGLDSSTAFKILQVLRANAKVGRVIVTTIHQPSSRLFPMFDKLILLSEGHPMFFGDAKDAMDYFASQQFIPQLPMNPAEFLLDLASGITSDITVPPELETKPFEGSTVGSETTPHAKSVSSLKMAGEPSSDTASRIDSLTPIEASVSKPRTGLSSVTEPDETQLQLVMELLRSKYNSELEAREKEKLRKQDGITPELKAAIQVKKNWTSSWCKQFFILCRRNWKERKNDYLNLLRFLQNIAVALLLSMLWWRPKLATEQGIRDQVGLLFYICIYWCTFSMWSTLMVFPLEKNYLAKERAADMYRLSAYFLSSTICDLLTELVHPTLFVALVYFTTGLKADFSTFLFTLLSVYLIAITAQAFGEFFGAATLSIKKVGIVSALIMLIFLLAGGYYVKNIPVFLKWIRYLSIVFYGFRLLEKVQYSPDQVYNCNIIEGCIRYDESPIFDALTLNGGFHDALALMCMAVIYKALAYLCLRRV